VLFEVQVSLLVKLELTRIVAALPAVADSSSVAAKHHPVVRVMGSVASPAVWSGLLSPNGPVFTGPV
jgi:hypothetical protein